MFTTSIFLLVIGFLLALFIGVNLSSEIDDLILYFLFWLMYIISIGTFVGIGASIYFYSIMRHKKGPRGPRGDRGDKGDKGVSGDCNKNCSDDLCNDLIIKHIVEILNKKEINNGGFQLSDFKNVYLKSKINSICTSPQFREYVGYRGPVNLINYLKTIWGRISEKIYESGGGSENGGIVYFKTVGAENTWNWIEDNPIDEFKKYDIYYWGLGKEYQPIINEDCSKSSKSNSAYRNLDTNDSLKTNRFGNEYSFLKFLKIPNVNYNINKNMVNQPVYVSTESGKYTVKLYDGFHFINDDDISKKYENTKLKPAKIIPGILLVSSFRSNKTCLAYTGSGSPVYRVSDKFDEEQHFMQEFTKSKPNKFKLKHVKTGMYLTRNKLITKYGSLYSYTDNS
tara:strand:+ start:4109 stop:5296 length:1188 start_codon:yes stop_codon:yes gene_type:complete